MAAALRSLIRELRRADNGRCDILNGRTRLKAHILEGSFGGTAFHFGGEARRIGNDPGDVGDHRGGSSPRHLRCQVTDVEFDARIERGTRVGRQLLPVGQRALPGLAFRSEWPAFKVGERGVVRHPCRRAPASMDCCRSSCAFHVKFADDVAAVFDDVSGCAVGTNLADEG